MTNSKKKLIVIVGPSGSGKTYLSNELKEHGIPKCVTATTREARTGEGEVHGEHYYFLSEQQFELMAFVETTTYNSNFYGTPIYEIFEKLEKFGKAHVVVDQSGVDRLRKMFPEEVKVVFLPITEDQMRERMVNRGDSKEEVESRIKYAFETGEFEQPNKVDFVYSVFGDSKLEDLLEFIG